MQFQNIVLKERQSVTKDLKAQFPIVTAYLNQEKYSLLLYLFQVKGQKNYLVLGSLPEELQDLLFSEWIRNLSQLFSFDLYQANNNSNEYLDIMMKLQASTITKKVLWTQEGFDFISGKHNFTKNEIIQRTIQLPFLFEKEKYIFGNIMYFINEQNRCFKQSPFMQYEEYDRNYFLNPADIFLSTEEQKKAFAFFHRYRIVRYAQASGNDSWLERWYREACSSNFVRAKIVSLQLLDFILKQNKDKENKNTL